MKSEYQIEIIDRIRKLREEKKIYAREISLCYWTKSRADR